MSAPAPPPAPLKGKKKVKKLKSPVSPLPHCLVPLVFVIAIGIVIAALHAFDVVEIQIPSFLTETPEARLTYKQSLEIGSGALKLMWATPIFTINLYNNSRIVGTNFNTRSFNVALQKAVGMEFKKFLEELEKKEGKEGHSNSGSSSRAYNELFFAWQRDAWERVGRTALDRYGEFVQMKSIMQSAASAFLDMTGHVMPERVELFSWATIHRECMFHLAHTHPLNLVSGVYYAKVPEGAGDIIFEDPRGPLPPFENRIIYTPKEGDLIVFPSWLLHQVTPTLGKEDRISFSFNIPGDWTKTADVSLTIPFK